MGKNKIHNVTLYNLYLHLPKHLQYDNENEYFNLRG